MRLDIFPITGPGFSFSGLRIPGPLKSRTASIAPVFAVAQFFGPLSLRQVEPPQAVLPVMEAAAPFAAVPLAVAWLTVLPAFELPAGSGL